MARGGLQPTRGRPHGPATLFHADHRVPGTLVRDIPQHHSIYLSGRFSYIILFHRRINQFAKFRPQLRANLFIPRSSDLQSEKCDPLELELRSADLHKKKHRGHLPAVFWFYSFDLLWFEFSLLAEELPELSDEPELLELSVFPELSDLAELSDLPEPSDELEAAALSDLPALFSLFSRFSLFSGRLALDDDL